MVHKNGCKTEKEKETITYVMAGKIHNELLAEVHSTGIDYFSTNKTIDEQINDILVIMEDYLKENYNYQKIIPEYGIYQNPYHLISKEIFYEMNLNGKKGFYDFVLESIQEKGVSPLLYNKIETILYLANANEDNKLYMEVGLLRGTKWDTEIDNNTKNIFLDVFQHSRIYWNSYNSPNGGVGNPDGVLEYTDGDIICGDAAGALAGTMATGNPAGAILGGALASLAVTSLF